MCRHLAWVGAPRSLASLVLEPPWSLQRQAYEPRRLDRGTVNADGFGVAWYDSDVRPEPARYRRAVPIWTDASFASFAPLVRASAFAAFLRSTTIGMPVQETDTAPYTKGRWAFGLNGSATLVSIDASAEGRPELESVCDATVLAKRVLPELAAGGPPDTVLGKVVTAVGAADPDARLNLLACDGATIVATRWGPSLCYLADEGLARGGVVVASEPLDDDAAWRDVPDRSLLVASADGVSLTPL